MAAQPFLAEGWARLSLLAAVPLTFLVFYLARLLSDWLHRPRVRAGAATPPEFALPPAVVGLLVEGANRAPRTMPATLLDLAARGHIKLSQPGADPMETTVEVPDNVDAETLTPYETSVLRWVRDAKQPTLATLAQWRRADVAGRSVGWKIR